MREVVGRELGPTPGVAIPVGLPGVFLEPGVDPLGDLLLRYARTHGPVTVTEVADYFGLGPAIVHDGLRRLVSTGRVAEGEFLPTGTGIEFCDAEVLRLLRRRSLASLRAEVEPVDTSAYARFLPSWQGVGGPLRGVDGLLRVVEQLSGALLPASALETLVLPSRVAAYSPALLDEVTAAGEIVWQGHGSLPGDDGWISLHLADTAALTLAEPDGDLGALASALLESLDGGGAFFFSALRAAHPSASEAAVTAALWELVWSGRVSGDTFAPIRGLLAGGRTAHRRPPSAGGRSARSPRRGSRALRIQRAIEPGDRV